MINDIRTLIVEDNHQSLLLLEKYLTEYPFVKVVATAKTVDEATLAFMKHRPRLIFLDVELDDSTGFEFLENVRELTDNVCVIFTTAYDHYALNAIKHSAFDYLLKPIDPEDLSSSLNKLLTRGFKGHDLLKVMEILNSNLEQNKPLKLNVKHGFLMVNPADIIYCLAEWSYTDIYLKGNIRQTVSFNLGNLEEKLQSRNFLRANRSLLLNLKYLHKVDREKGTIVLKTGKNEISLKLTAAKIRKLEKLLDEREKGE